MLMGLIIGSGIRLFFVLRHPFLWTVSVWHVFHHPENPKHDPSAVK
jgi:hypothetical protein